MITAQQPTAAIFAAYTYESHRSHNVSNRGVVLDVFNSYSPFIADLLSFFRQRNKRPEDQTGIARMDDIANYKVVYSLWAAADKARAAGAKLTAMVGQCPLLLFFFFSFVHFFLFRNPPFP